MKKKLLNLALTFFTNSVYADVSANHGMLIFGDKATYASHLPMFHQPHNYQLLMRLDLFSTEANSQIMDKYLDAKKNGIKLFTMVLHSLDLTKVIDGSIMELNASVFAGHFERGGVLLGETKVKIKKVIYAKKLDAQENFKNDYLIFGENGEYYASHVIKGKPNFDLIAQVKQPSESVLDCPSPRAGCQMLTFLVQDEKLPINLTFENTNDAVIEGSILTNENIFSSQTTKIEKVIYSEFDELK